MKRKQEKMFRLISRFLTEEEVDPKDLRMSTRKLKFQLKSLKLKTFTEIQKSQNQSVQLHLYQSSHQRVKFKMKHLNKKAKFLLLRKRLLKILTHSHKMFLMKHHSCNCLSANVSLCWLFIHLLWNAKWVLRRFFYKVIWKWNI
jgi:hypothetical protein